MSSENDSRKDPAWKYAIRDGSNIFAFKCNFCSKTLNGGVFRVKQHLAGGYRNVVACPKCPQPVRQEIKEYMAKKKEAKEQLNKVIDIDERVGDDDYDMDIDTDSQPLPSTQDSSSYISNKGKRPIMRKPTRKGAIDCYFTPDAETVVEMRRKTGKQPKIDENNASKKELAKRAYQKIARFVYDSGIPLSVVQNPSFAHMVQAIGDYGPDLPPPSYYQIRVPLLKDEKLHVQNMMRDHIVARETNGCTLMCDGCNEWLVGVPEEERVFDDDDLRWDDVAAAAGVEEPIRSTRSTYNRRPTTSKTSKASSSSRPSAFRIVDEEEEEEWEDLGGESDEGEEQDVDGYASEDDAQIDLSINDD